MGTSAEPAFRRWSSGRAIRRALAKSRQESRPVPPRQCRAVGSAVGLRRHKRRLHRSLYVVTTSAPQYSLSWHYTKRLHDQEESWRGRGTARPSRGCLSQGCQPVPRLSRTLLRPAAAVRVPSHEERMRRLPWRVVLCSAITGGLWCPPARDKPCHRCPGRRRDYALAGRTGEPLLFNERTSLVPTSSRLEAARLSHDV